jgi:alkanesulfonate monooxygenase SsuD/methylene tetrahydromethanopterin reductase-like flavin-dependent oxidoreductase (luciferase family)
MTVATGTRSLKVGLMLPQTEGMRGPGVRGWREVAEMAKAAEDVGFDSLWVVDHLVYQLEGEELVRGVWEGWSLLSAIAAITNSVEIGTLVLALGWRNPALLAKMADTVDEISGGRLILGLGAGYHKLEYDMFGYPYAHRVGRFEEGIQIIHGLLRTGQIDFEGEFYSARECELKPRGPRPEGCPILIGTCKPRMGRLMATYGDIWNAYYDDTFNKVDGVTRLKPIIDGFCEKQGRDPATLERSCTVLVADDSGDAWWDRLPSEQYAEEGQLVPLNGSPESMAEVLLEYQAAGISHIQASIEPTTPEVIEKFGRVLEAIDAASN